MHGQKNIKRLHVQGNYYVWTKVKVIVVSYSEKLEQLYAVVYP